MRKKENTPLYKKVIDDLKALIDQGEYKQGELLPSENELCKTYSTTRVTIRQALSGLTNMGYITRRHGKGSIVSEPKKGLGILSLNGVTAGIGDQKLLTSILQKPVEQPWPIGFGYDLSEEDQQAGCIFFSRVRFINDKPVLFEETYLSNRILPGFVALDLENRSLFKTLQDHYQVEVKEGEQQIWAIHGDKRISKLLSIKTSHPIVHMKRKLNTNLPGLHIYSILYCNTEEYFLQDFF